MPYSGPSTRRSSAVLRQRRAGERRASLGRMARIGRTNGTFSFDIVSAAVVGGMLLATTVAETLSPLRPRTKPRRIRWPRNAAFGALAAAIVRAAVVPAMFASARSARRRNIGLARWSCLGPTAQTLVSFVALDYTMYWWHRALHHVPLLWRSHAIHHVDRDLD